MKINKFDAAESSDGMFPLQKYVWNDVPSSTKSFQIGGSVERNVVVIASAVVYNDGSVIWVRLLVDGVVQGIGSMAGGVRGATGYQTPSFAFVTSALAPGTHTAKLEAMSEGGVDDAIYRWAYVILHT